MSLSLHRSSAWTHCLSKEKRGNLILKFALSKSNCYRFTLISNKVWNVFLHRGSVWCVPNHLHVRVLKASMNINNILRIEKNDTYPLFDTERMRWDTGPNGLVKFSPGTTCLSSQQAHTQRVVTLHTAPTTKQQRGEQWESTVYCQWAQRVKSKPQSVEESLEHLEATGDDFSSSIYSLSEAACNWWWKSIPRCFDVIGLWCSEHA